MESSENSKIIALLLEVGQYLIKHQNSVEISTQKEYGDISTDADLKAEKMICDVLRREYPDFEIYSEETLSRPPVGQNYIVVDPIDGSKNYYRHMPEFAISIMFVRNGEPSDAFIHIPASGEIFTASRGHGATCINNGVSRAVKVSKPTAIHQILHVEIPTVELRKSSSTEYDEAMKTYEKLVKNAYRVRSMGSGAIALCYCADRRFDGYADLSGTTKPFDLVAGILICEEVDLKVISQNKFTFVGISKELLETVE